MPGYVKIDKMRWGAPRAPNLIDNRPAGVRTPQRLIDWGTQSADCSNLFSRSRMSKLHGHFRPTWVTSIPDDFKKSLQGNVICAVGSSVVDKGSLKRLKSSASSQHIEMPRDVSDVRKQLISPHKGEVWCQHCGQCWSHCEAFGWGRMCRTVVPGLVAHDGTAGPRQWSLDAIGQCKLCKQFPCCDVLLHVVTNPGPERLCFLQCDAKLKPGWSWRSIRKESCATQTCQVCRCHRVSSRLNWDLHRGTHRQWKRRRNQELQPPLKGFRRSFIQFSVWWSRIDDAHPNPSRFDVQGMYLINRPYCWVCDAA